jgi:RNA-binding protein 5/10
VQFQEVDHAVAFMREHYPKFLVEMSHSTDDVPEGKFDAYIHYARSRDARDDTDARGVTGSNWTCPTVGMPSLSATHSLTDESATFRTTLYALSARSVVVPRPVS